MPRQAGETWLTLKVTRAGLGRTNEKVVVRRRFGPVVPIQGRDELKWLTGEGSDGPPLVAFAPPELELGDEPL
jgi:hypothetical protein